VQLSSGQPEEARICVACSISPVKNWFKDSRNDVQTLERHPLNHLFNAHTLLTDFAIERKHRPTDGQLALPPCATGLFLRTPSSSWKIRENSI
jgi:hypothetical protein